MTLAIPDIGPDDDTLAAAFAYAKAGWYVLPINRATKHAGSVLGKGWPAKTSRDPQQIAAWFAGTDHGLALHCGRSGAVVFDVDDPDQLPAQLVDELTRTQPPMQATRVGNNRRGHYLYRQPSARDIGNSTGKLGGAWGEVRGRNGIIVVAPTPHEKAAAGGRYHWLRTGPLPDLPDSLAELLPDQHGSEDAVTDNEVRAFLDRHTASVRPELVDGIVTSFQTALERGAGRHPSAIEAACWAVREARAGLFPARPALQALYGTFRDALRDEPHRNPSAEWYGIVAWAIGQGEIDDAAATFKRLTETDPFGDGEEAASSTSSEPSTNSLDLMREVARLRLQREARRIVEAEDRPPVRPPEVMTLRERLARPLPPVTYRIEGWQPKGSRVVLAAQFKAGKTTTTGNLARCLVDGDAWLDRFKVEPIDGIMAILDFEMSAEQMDQWLGDQHIRNDDRIVPIPMRGNALAFDILDPGVRTQWATKLRDLGCQYLVLDCLRPVLDALGLDEHRDAGRFLVAFDALLAEAQVPEATVVHHMGHTGERSRGDSRIRDWPDVEWRLVRESAEDPASPRYMSAFGRDVDQPEAQLVFDDTNRHLTLIEGNRREVAARAALNAVLVLVDEQPRLSGNQIEQALAESDHTQKAIREAIKLGLRERFLALEKGPRNANLYVNASFSSSVRQTSSPVRQRGGGEFVSSSIDDELTTTNSTEPSSSADEVGRREWFR